MLVAPVVEEGARVRSVYLPAGRWYDWKTGEVLTGRRYVDVPVTLEDVPIFVKAGTIVPTMPVQQYTGENPNADIFFNVYPDDGHTASYTLYEDDGESLDYQKDIYTERTVSCTQDGNSYAVEAGPRVNHGGYEYGLQRSLIVRIPCSKRPAEVTLNGKKLRGSWNRKSRSIEIRIPD